MSLPVQELLLHPSWGLQARDLAPRTLMDEPELPVLPAQCFHKFIQFRCMSLGKLNISTCAHFHALSPLHISPGGVNLLSLFGLQSSNSLTQKKFLDDSFSEAQGCCCCCTELKGNLYFCYRLRNSSQRLHWELAHGYVAAVYDRQELWPNADFLE